jgi:(1->4)-alpha-D-glucan 1-alpha-D-glucosylmutase
LLLKLPDEEDLRQPGSVTEFAMRFQQFTGPVMAKGLEDTSFYIYNRLVSLNEVGGDPRRFGVSVPAFHWNNRERASQSPHAMLNTSTHDSKRSEDVRSRINVLSEVPDVWQQMVKRWSRMNRSKKQKLDVMFAPSKNDEYALYQILIGAWPFQDGEDEGSIMAEFSRRVEAYMIKAVREAKVHSSWINPNSQYEDATVSFIRALFEDPNRNRFLQEFVTFQSQIGRLGIYNSLSQVLLKLTSPGVPDIYQGNEIWNLSLVDPDNRHPVDFARRRQMLEELQSFVSVSEEVLVSRANELLKTMEDGRIKLYVTWRTLALRYAFQDVFRGGIYLALKAHGEKADNLCAFARQHEDRWAIVAAPRLYAGLCGIESEVAPLGRAVWSDTWVETPFCPTGTQLKNVFTGEILTAETRQDTAGLNVAGLLGSFPVALLTKA